MAAKFVAEEGEMKGLTLSLEAGDEWVIGRDPEACQLLIEDPSASRKHLVCRASPEGIVVENLSETNPVEVNDEAVKEPRLLKNGDSVKIGNGIFRFYTEGEAQVLERQEDKAKIAPASMGDAMKNEDEHDTIFEETSEEDKGVLAEIDFDLRETGRWLLKVIGGPNNGAEFSMQTGSSYTIGTDPTACDVVFHDTSVSRQHARITISDGNILAIEDLKSRNGTLVDGEPVEGKKALEPNTLVSLGTTSFIVFDREGDMQTIISPLLPSIVKVLQKDSDEKFEDEKMREKELSAHTAAALAAVKAEEEKKRNPMGALVLIGIVSALFVVVGIGTMTLFQSEPIQIRKEINYNAELERALAPFPSVRFSFTPSTGRLLLVGHVLTLSDKNQLLYNLQGLEFLKSLDDDGLIVDEYVWRETNSILNRDPRWKGIGIHSPTAGTFVLSGYLQTRKQSEELTDYIQVNFPYLDLLERRVIVEEDILNLVDIELQNAGIRNLSVQINNGVLTLSGGLSKEQMVGLDRLTRKFKEIQGIQNVKTFINELEPEQTMMNITDRYKVTGSSHQGGANLNVVINGRILSRGDILDGMTITSIRPNSIFLEKDGVKYRIDYNQQ
jgi:type III secretion system YscD/HrpQ family protein